MEAELELAAAAEAPVPETRAAPCPSTEPDEPALFSLDEAPDAWHALTLELSTEEHDRLLQRARSEGLSPEEFLRGLI